MTYGAGGRGIQYTGLEGLASQLVKVPECCGSNTAGWRFDCEDGITNVCRGIECVVGGNDTEERLSGGPICREPFMVACIGQAQRNSTEGQTAIERDVEVDGSNSAGVAGNPLDGCGRIGNVRLTAIGYYDRNSRRGGIGACGGDKVILDVGGVDIGDAA